MQKTLFKNAKIVNRSQIREADLLVKGEKIEKIASDISDSQAKVIDLQGLALIPGCIDDQVHFREPGLTHKATIRTESAAAVAGGVTSFMEMPNTQPQATSQVLLEQKYQIATIESHANFSFYMGTTNENYDEVMKTNLENVCGLKIFMGSSTGNMLVDKLEVLEKIFSSFPGLIATHCEDENTIKRNSELFLERYGSQLSALHHPLIRSREACLISSKSAVELAKKHGTRLHVLHISTAEECKLFEPTSDLSQKKITAEACVHHMYFSDDDYERLGNLIKCNPAIKSRHDRIAIFNALESGNIDVIATDHAPHTLQEKTQNYLQSPSGLPLVQHSLLLAYTTAKKNQRDLTWVVQKMAHNPAICFKIRGRGFLDEGYYADLVVFDPDGTTQIRNSDVLYKCGWTPLDNDYLKGKIMSTWVNGQCVWDGRNIISAQTSKRLVFGFNV